MSSQLTEAGALAVKAEISNATTGAFLTPEQQNYAVGRIEELAGRELADFLAANEYAFPARPRISLDEKFVMLRDGKCTLKDFSKKKKSCQLPNGEHTTWDQMFDFPETLDQVAWDVVDAERKNYTKALAAKREVAIDQIVIGHGAAANDIIAGFGVGAPDPRKAKKG